LARIVILGAGVAGLAAAYRLKQLRPADEVTIVEQADKPGGLARSWKNREFAADLGPHRIYTELPEIEALLPELIARDQMLTVSRRSELYLHGHYFNYPVRAFELLKVLGPIKMSALAFSAIAGKLRGLARKAANYEEAMEAAFGRGVYRMIVQPYTRKVWKIEPERLSEEVARVRVSAGNAAKLIKQLLGKFEGKKGSQSALSSFSYIRGGVEGLVTSLMEKVTRAGTEVVTQCRVSGLNCDHGALTGIQVEGGGTTRTIHADYVISTVPVTDLVSMLQPCSENAVAARAAGELVYIGLILVAVVVKRAQFTPNSWIYFPEEKFVFNRSYEPRNFDPSMAPADKTIAVFEVTARWDSELWQQADAEVIRQVRSDVLKTGLLTEQDIDDMFVLRVPHTYPLYTIEFRQQLEEIFQYLRGFANLITTGRQGLFNHNNMDHSMLMGIKAAECLDDAIKAGRPAAANWYDSLGQFSHFRIVD